MNTNDSPTNAGHGSSRMSRPRDGRMIAGVAAAYADRLSLDVNVVRIVFVVSAFFGGFGLLVYLATWALLPDEGETLSPAQKTFGKSS